MTSGRTMLSESAPLEHRGQHAATLVFGADVACRIEQRLPGCAFDGLPGDDLQQNA